MRAGKLDRLVRLEENTPSRSGTGDMVDGWGLVAQIWAGRRDDRGREFFSGGELTGEAVTIWVARWRDGVRTAMRIVDGADVWDITSIAETAGRHKGLELACPRQGA